MSFVLDPQDVAGATEVWTPSEALPSAVLKFGYVPDVDLWKAGDLLLFSSVNPDWISKSITRAQSRGWTTDRARWQHAAVYIGRSRICEATMWGVGIASIYKYVPTHLIQARRCPILDLDLAGSHDLVVAALIRLNRWYSFSTAASIWWKSLSRFPQIEFAMVTSRTHICSHLYSDSYSQATERVLETIGTPTPASLCASAKLVDVDSRWKRLAP